jgi:two-component system cell cycle response regulator
MARILVIEDNPANLDLMVYLLRAFGHQPIQARDGKSGLEASRDGTADLVLCDLQLPDIDGYEVARQIRSNTGMRGVPLVAVTAYAMVGDRNKVLAAGFDGYIPKPIIPEKFVQEMEAYLRPDQRSKRHQEPHETGGSALRPAARATVLVVDDLQVNIDLLRGILEPSGYTVVASYPVREAVSLAARFPPDIIVSDLRMPGDDGSRLKNRRPSWRWARPALSRCRLSRSSCSIRLPPA